MSVVKAKVSTVVSKQVPEFIREDNPTFVSFLKAYYEFLDTYQKRDLESIRDVDETVDTFVQYIEKELMMSIPKNILADRALLAKHIKELYDSKGNIGSYELLFRILYNEPVELYFPKVDILRVSDGKWSSPQKIRVTAVSGNPINLVGQFLYQGSSRLGVDSIIKMRLVDTTIYEITITDKSLVGELTTGENLVGVDNKDGSQIVVNLNSGLVQMQVLDQGSYYRLGRRLTIVSGTGRLATADIGSISAGSIEKILVDYPGTGYKVGDVLNVNNNNAGIGGKGIKVSLEAVVSEVALPSIVLEDDSGYLTLENKSQIVQEGQTYGGIKSVQILNPGQSYAKVPIVTAPTSVTEDYAKFTIVAPEVGRIVTLNVTDPGLDYTTVPFAKPETNIVLNNITGTFSESEDVQILPQSIALETGDELLLEDDSSRLLMERQSSASATIYEIDRERNLFVLNPSSFEVKITKEDGSGYIVDNNDAIIVTEDSEYWREGQTLTNASGATGKIVSVGQAYARGVVGGVYNSVGKLLNADGKIGDSSKKIQDSKYYQDYSYVVQTNLSTNYYRDAVKKLLHPLGLALFGNVKTQSVVPSTVGTAKFVRGTSIPTQTLTLMVKDLVFGGIRAFSRYRTPYEDRPDINKLEMTLIITDLLKAHLTMFSTNPEFLPELDVPRMTPDQVHLLDLRTDHMQDLWILYIMKILDLRHTIIRQTDLIFPSKSNMVFGPTWKTLEQFKFNFPPYQTGSKTLTGYATKWFKPYTGSSNEDYWAPINNPEYQFGNTQIVHFANITIEEVINNPDKKINLALDSDIDVIYVPQIVTFDMTNISYDSTQYTV